MPEFAERDEARTRGKRLRLAPLVSIAMSKRAERAQTLAPAMPADYRVDAAG